MLQPRRPYTGHWRPRPGSALGPVNTARYRRARESPVTTDSIHRSPRNPLSRRLHVFVAGLLLASLTASGCRPPPGGAAAANRPIQSRTDRRLGRGGPQTIRTDRAAGVAAAGREDPERRRYRRRVSRGHRATAALSEQEICRSVGRYVAGTRDMSQAPAGEA